MKLPLRKDGVPYNNTNSLMSFHDRISTENGTTKDTKEDCAVVSRRTRTNMESTTTERRRYSTRLLARSNLQTQQLQDPFQKSSPETLVVSRKCNTTDSRSSKKRNYWSTVTRSSGTIDCGILPSE
jgi:hypothetical protein